MKSMPLIRAAVLPMAAVAIWSVPSASPAAKYCSVEQVDPDTMWLMDTSDLPSCKTVIENTRTLGKNQRYAQIGGRVYWVQERQEPHSIELMEIAGPVAFDRLKSYLAGTYASDGNILLYGGHRVHTKDLLINPGGLRRFSGYGTELSQYVTDGRLVFYKDRMLEGADAASFELIAQPTAKEKSEPELARDISGVYYGADRITDADPVSFRLADFSVTTEGNIHGYYGIDRAHVWNLSNGFQLVMPEYADGIRQRLQKALPLTPEPWKIPRPIKVWGSALLLLIACYLIYRLQERISSRYQASLLSRAVGVLSGAYLVLPTVGYALLFSRCSKPNDIVVWALLAGGLAGGAWLLSVANSNFMSYADAAATTIVQLGMVAVVLALGMLPAGLIEGLSSIPAGISRQCPREDHDVEARNRIKVASMQNGIRFNVTEKRI